MGQSTLQEFWSLYDHYVADGDISLRPKLSQLLAGLEKKSKTEQIIRPEKDWNQILAWQVLRSQSFVFSDKNPFYVHEGEIIVWAPHWDRDVFVTRVPINEFVSGQLIKPGYILTHNDQGSIPDDEWRTTVRYHGLTDERGLYLPIFEPETLMKLCDRQTALIRENIKTSLIENSWIPPVVVQNL